MGIQWAYCGNTALILWEYTPVGWEWSGSTEGIPWQYYWNTMGILLGVLWECSGNTMGGKHGSTLGVLRDVGIACGNMPGVS